MADQRATPPEAEARNQVHHLHRAGAGRKVQHGLNINTLRRDQETKELGPSEVGRVLMQQTTVPLLCDPYSKNRTTGSFILIDEATGVTDGAGMTNSGG